MPNTPAFLEFLMEQFGVMGMITARSMFGGHCLYCDGTVFGLLAGNQVYLKVDAETRAEFEARGLKPFRPFDNQEMTMSYYAAPAEIFDSGDALRHWGGLAVAAGLRSSKPRAARRKPPKKTRRQQS